MLAMRQWGSLELSRDGAKSKLQDGMMPRMRFPLAEGWTSPAIRRWLDRSTIHGIAARSATVAKERSDESSEAGAGAQSNSDLIRPSRTPYTDWIMSDPHPKAAHRPADQVRAHQIVPRDHDGGRRRDHGPGERIYSRKDMEADIPCFQFN